MSSMGIQYQPYTVIPTLLGSDIAVLGHSWSQNDVIMSWLRLTATSNCFPHLYWTYTKWLSTLICYLWAYSISLTQLYPHYLGQILEFSVTCGVNMMSLCHGWGWPPTQTDSHIHIRHTKSVWSLWYAVHGDKVAALHSYTHTLGSNLGALSHLRSQNVVSTSWLRLTATSNCFPSSILDIYKVFEHIDMLSMGIQ